MQILRIVLVALCVLALACSGDKAGRGLRVGMTGEEAGAGVAGAAGFGNPNAGAGLAGVPSNDNALEVEIEHEDLAVELITLRCRGECADVEAVATGGHAPYAFTWDDGPSTAIRTLCPEQTTSFGVQVRDTAIETDELGYEAQTARAEVTAKVLECDEPDAGGVETPCLENPSFEGPVTPTQLEAFMAPPWNACYAGGLAYAAIGDDALWPLQNWTFPEASDGETFLALGQQLGFVGLASQTLCEPLAAGSARSFLVDLAHATTTDPGQAEDQAVEILGGSGECSEETVLWSSPPLTTDWATYCVTLAPERELRTLGFRALARDGGLVEALVDNIVPVERCP
jgi:hypothetical protein